MRKTTASPKTNNTAEQTDPSKIETPEEVEFPTEVLVKSKAFKDYHPCFVRALLTKDKYTKAEALRIVKNYFK